MINSRKDINKTNELITDNWKNALIIMKTASIFQKILNGLRLALDKHDLIRKYKFRDPNFKEYFYTENIAFTLAKSQKYYIG
jgi:hypothetical protein